MIKDFIDKLLKKDPKTITIAIVVVIFALFLLKSCIQPGKGKIAGEIFGKKVYQSDFDFALAKTRIQAQFSYGSLYDNIKHFLDLETQTWEQILLNHEAKQRKVFVTSKEVIKYIATNPLFQRGKKFNVTLYKNFVRQSLGTSTEVFEGSMKDYLTLRKLFAIITESIALTEKQVFQQYKNANEKLKISYVFLPFDKAIKNISVPEKEMLRYYDKNKEDFRVPPSVKLEYIQLNYPKDAGVQKKTEIKFKAKAIYQEYQKKEDLEKLATKFGFPLKETEYFTRGNTSIGTDWPYDILAEAFELGLDKIRKPIKLENGWLIIRNKDKRSTYIPEFIEAVKQVKNLILLKKAEEISLKNSQEILTKITEATKDNLTTESFKAAAEELGLKIKNTNLLPKQMIASILGITNSEREKVFALNANNKLSQVIPVDNGQYIVFVEDFKPVNPVKYQKDKEVFNQQILTEKKEESFANFLKEIKLKSGLKTYTFPEFHL